MKGGCRGIGGRDGWNVEILEQFGRPPRYPEGGNVRYRRHDESEDERRLNGQVTGGVVAPRWAEKEVSGFRRPHPEREELPKGGHHRVLHGEQECGEQSVADQHGEEGGLRLGLVDPGGGRATFEAVMSGEDEREPEDGKAEASASDLVEHAEGERGGQGEGAAGAGGLDEGERDGRREGGEEVSGERKGGRFLQVRLEEGDEDAEKVVDGPHADVARVVRSWVRRALCGQEGAAAGRVDVAE